MLPSFSLQRAKIHGFQDLFETESAGKLWRTHSVGCRRGKALAKIVKAESLRQKDGEHRHHAGFSVLTFSLYCFLSCRSSVESAAFYFLHFRLYNIRRASWLHHLRPPFSLSFRPSTNTSATTFWSSCCSASASGTRSKRAACRSAALRRAGTACSATSRSTARRAAAA